MSWNIMKYIIISPSWPSTSQCEVGVQKIVHLQKVNELPDAFTNTNGVTKSHIPTTNVPTKIEVSRG